MNGVSIVGGGVMIMAVIVAGISVQRMKRGNIVKAAIVTINRGKAGSWTPPLNTLPTAQRLMR